MDLGDDDDDNSGDAFQKPARSPIVARIDIALAAAGLTRERACSKAGLVRGYLQKLEERHPKIIPKDETLEKFANLLAIPIDELRALAKGVREDRGGQNKRVTEATRTAAPVDCDAEPSLSPAHHLPGDWWLQGWLPVRGTARGGAIGSFVFGDAIIGYVRTPPALVRVKDAYAVYVSNNSMEPAHNQGDLRLVHPHRPPRAQDTIIVQIRNVNGDYEAYIKIFVRQTAEWLICRQLNPAAEVKFAMSQVFAVHTVLTMNELFNAP